ncbi:MAG: acylphosphatase [Rhodoplanes sp.]|jgi:acylphosphatase
MAGKLRVIRHLFVRGRVQGIGYRAWAASEATRHGLEGWVRNRRDGSVEAVIAGSPDKVAAMIEAARRGPWLARVTGMDVGEGTVRDLEDRRRGESFSVLSTM